MSRDHTRTPATPQLDVAQFFTEFQQQSTTDLRANKLRQRFALAPELARTVAALAFTPEAGS